MVAHKEFQGKTLDDAIREACEYFGVAREKLEIDIVSDAKSGIFGLVGATKATIHAARVDLPAAVDALLKDEAPAGTPGKAPGTEESAPKKKQAARKQTPRKQTQDMRPQEPRAENPAPATHRAAAACPDCSANEGASGDTLGDTPSGSREELPDIDLANCDQDRLFAVIKDVVYRLVYPIVGDVPCTVSIAGSRVRAALDCGDASGLLVGRDGQTLASVQCLASRIIARQIGGSVRLQVDAGKYRERQDDQLKELAFSLAKRVKEIGRPLSTRPLTAYQRRVVHLALEHDEAVQTHSKGEGSQRKVTISPKRGNEKNEHGFVSAESGLESGEDRAAPSPAAKPRPAKRGNAREGQRRGQRTRKPRSSGAE